MTLIPFTGSTVQLSTVAWDQHNSLYSPHFYDQNFISFKVSPFFEEFIEIEAFQKRTTQSDALVFKFPPFITPRPGVSTYLSRHGYDLIKLNIYRKEDNFHTVHSLPEGYDLKQVEPTDLTEFLNYQYQQDLPLGKEFAEGNQDMLKQLFDSGDLVSYIIRYEGEIIAQAQYLQQKNTIELYYIEVDPNHRQKGVASYLQQTAKKDFPKAAFFAVADADDATANKMYQSLGYSLDYWFLQFQKVMLNLEDIKKP